MFKYCRTSSDSLSPQRKLDRVHPLKITAFASLLFVAACGGGGGSPQTVSSAPADVPAEPRGAPLRFSGVAPDANSAGPYPVSAAVDYQYDAIIGSQNIVEDRDDPDLHTTTSHFPDPIDVLGVIHYPIVSLSNPAPANGFPVILFQHGRHSTCSDTGAAGGTESTSTDCESEGLVPIRSDKGYDYIAETMASHGYVVISIDVNDINAQDANSNDQGITARAEAILHHLDIFRDIDANVASTFRIDNNGSDFSSLFGQLDFDRVGLMGHSRGGNGVAKTVSYNADARFRRSSSFDQPHTILGVFSLAPTDFNSELPTNTAWVTLSPYCDGDVSTLHGVYMYDNLRYEPSDTSGPQFQITSMGANHNFYNDFWFNDDADLNGADPYCSAGVATSGRFSRPDQKRHGEFLIASFLRLFVGGEAQFSEYWNGRERAPSSACPEGVGQCDERLHLAFHRPPAELIVVDDTLDSGSLAVNNLGQSNVYQGFTQTGWCNTNGGSLEDTLGRETDRCPSASTISKAPQLFLRWSGIAPSLQINLSATGLDASAADFFTVRMGVVVTQENANGQDFTLTLVDANGVEASVLASDFSDALYFPPGLTVSARDTGAKTIMNMVPFRLDAKPWVDAGIDLSQLIEARIDFDQTPAGTVQFTDVLFQQVD